MARLLRLLLLLLAAPEMTPCGEGERFPAEEKLVETEAADPSPESSREVGSEVSSMVSLSFWTCENQNYFSKSIQTKNCLTGSLSLLINDLYLLSVVLGTAARYSVGSRSREGKSTIFRDLIQFSFT